MADNERAKFHVYNSLAWVLDHGMVTENGIPIEVFDHYFLAAPYMDNSPQVVVRKCAQIGYSTLQIIRAFHLARFWLANVIYTMPTRNAAKEFVVPKVDPIVRQNPVIQEMIQDTNSVSLKKVGDRFIYFRGSWAEAEAISTSADVLFLDEYDRSAQKILSIYESRLKASKMKWIHAFSNPSIEDFGVDSLWKESDQKHWMIKCHHCNERQYMDWPESIDIENQRIICVKCGRGLNKKDRRAGEWIAKRENADWSGYWISHFMAPWITAKEIIRDSKKDKEYFYNFVLGKAYTAEDMKLGRSEIIRALVPGTPPAAQNAMGVDVGITKHYVIGNEHGIFRVGSTESWEEIERLITQYSAVTVIDANPYPTRPKQLAKRYRNQVFICYYGRDRKSMATVRWGDKGDRGIVFVDRTKIFDQVVAEIGGQELLFSMTERELEEYIHHWEAMYRVIKEDAMGIQRGHWETKEGAQDHYCHAQIYQRIAMEKIYEQDSGIVGRARKFLQGKGSPNVADGEIPAIDIQKIAKASGKIGKRDWRYT